MRGPDPAAIVEGHRLFALEETDVPAGPPVSSSATHAPAPTLTGRLSADDGGTGPAGQPPSRSTLLVSEEIARWLIADAKRDAHNAFTRCAPFFCKLCDQPIEPAHHARHLRGHASQLAGLARVRQRENVKRLRTVGRLRKESRV